MEIIYEARYSYIIPNNYGIFLLDHDATISSNDKKIYQMCILKAVPISSSTYLALVSRWYHLLVSLAFFFFFFNFLSFIVLATFKIPSNYISSSYNCLILKCYWKSLCFPQKQGRNSIQIFYFNILSQCPDWIQPGECPGKNLAHKTTPRWNKFEFSTSPMHIT